MFTITSYSKSQSQGIHVTDNYKDIWPDKMFER